MAKTRKKMAIWKVLVPLATALCLPFAFNACQGKFLGGSFASSSQGGARCKAMLQDGVVKEVKFNANEAPSPFRLGKVQLGGRDSGDKSLSKVTPPIIVDAGTQLGVLIDNKCLLETESLAALPISSAARASGETVESLDRQVYLWSPEHNSTEAEIEVLADADPCVVGVSWNRRYKMQAFNDANFAQQTHLSAIHAEQSYQRFYAGAGTMQMTGDPVLIAVIDSGVDYTHPDLSQNIWQHSLGSGIDITTVGTSNVSYNPSDVSPIGHGTHVAGTIAAVSNNLMGVVGAMPYRAQVMAIKIFDQSNNTTTQHFYNGIKFAYQNGAKVINLSLGSVENAQASDALAQTAVNEAVQNGVVTIVVVGNEDSGGNGRLVDGVNLSSIPGQYATTAGVIGVGSFDALTGNKSYFSHFSTLYAEIGAPGAEQGQTGILSTLPVSKGSYGRLEGTSQAAPIVAAAAGLTIGLIREAYGISPSPAEVERLLLTSAIKSNSLKPYFKDGNRLDFVTLVNQINASYPKTANGQSPISLSENCY